MKFLVLSDLHANWWALRSVLKEAEGQYEQILCCGDLVGYNARPAEIIQWTQQNCRAVIRGNHDKVVAGLENLDWFNEVAQAAAIWTTRELNQDELNYVRSLPQGPLAVDGFQLCHGSPLDEDEYVLHARDAAAYLARTETMLTFFGHTHVQGGFYLQGGKAGVIGPVNRSSDERVLELDPAAAYMINPGSVGQPRDNDPRAAWVVYNTDEKTITYHRTEYPVDETAREIKDAGLPDVLAYRLFRGL